MVRLTDIFRHVGSIQGIFDTFELGQGTESTKRVLRYFFPFRRQHVHTHYQYFRSKRVIPARHRRPGQARSIRPRPVRAHQSFKAEGRQVRRRERTLDRLSPASQSRKSDLSPIRSADQNAVRQSNAAVSVHDAGPDQDEQSSEDDEDVIEYAKREREEAYNSYRQADEELGYHRKNYWQMLQTHWHGEDPGLPDWSPTWTKEHFDREHLRLAMRLSGRLRRAQERLENMLDICARAGIEPLDWQDEKFPVGEPNYYPESVEEQMIAAAPRDRVDRWRYETAEHDSLLEGQRPIPDDSHNPGQYPPEHEVDWPPEVDLEIGREIQPFDSGSCVADQNYIFHGSWRRLRQYQTSPPPSWTWRGPPEKLEPDNSRVLRSHYF